MLTQVKPQQQNQLIFCSLLVAIYNFEGRGHEKENDLLNLSFFFHQKTFEASLFSNFLCNQIQPELYSNNINISKQKKKPLIAQRSGSETFKIVQNILIINHFHVCLFKIQRK